MEYNSDYSVRLATLGALGGDTAKTYDSVYDIDLEILRLTEQGGGGGGMSYEQIQQALAETGVTSIKMLFQDYSGYTVDDHFITNKLDNRYIVATNKEQLTQLGGMYRPHTEHEGAIAYLTDYVIANDQKMVVTVDYQDSNTDDPFNVRVDYGNDDVYYIKLYTGGNDIYLRDIDGSGDGIAFDGLWDDRLNMHSSDISDAHNLTPVVPLRFHFRNGATGTLMSVSGISTDPWEVRNVFYLDKYNNTFPTVTFEYENKTIVETGATQETLEMTYPAKGWYQFSNKVTDTGATADKWLEYEIYCDALSKSEFQTMMEHFYQYQMPLTIHFKYVNHDSKCPEDLVCHVVNLTDNRSVEDPQREFYFTSDVMQYQSTNQIFKCHITYDSTHGWYFRDSYFVHIPTDNDINEVRDDSRKIIFGCDWELGKSKMEWDFQNSTLFNVAASGSVEMEVWKLQINASQYDINDYSMVGYFYGNRNGDSMPIWYKNGKIRARQITFDAEANPDWQIMYYTRYAENGTNMLEIAALKITDDGNDKYTIWCGIPAITGDSRWDYIDLVKNEDEEWKQNWVKAANETLTVTPHLYSSMLVGRENDQDVRKLIRLI